jgi:galactokinase
MRQQELLPVMTKDPLHVAEARNTVATNNQQGLPARLQQRFQQHFGKTCILVRAPGRVNLIGEHTDYNDGFVMPAAIDASTWVAIAPREDRIVKIHSEQFDEEFAFNLDDHAAPHQRWTDYVQGVAVTLNGAGFRLKGADLLIDSTVPMGAGLSSSAALEVAAGFALLRIAEQQIDLVSLAKLCQRAENEFVGARVGIMDQFISCLGEEAHCLMIDCRSLQFEKLPIPPTAGLVICNTMVKHEHAGGEYNRRRSECEQAVALLSQYVPDARSLRDISPEQFQQFGANLPEVIRKRARHVISEIRRTEDAAAALRSHDLRVFGELMMQSHNSLRDDYEVSCRELDLMVEIALQKNGIYGGRLTGGGFGGCTVNLVKNEAIPQFIVAVAAEYERAVGIRPEIYVSRAASGVGQVARPSS